MLAEAQTLRGVDATSALYERAMKCDERLGSVYLVASNADGSDAAYLESAIADEDAAADVATGEPVRITEKLRATPVAVAERREEGARPAHQEERSPHKRQEQRDGHDVRQLLV